KGRRPDFTRAASSASARVLYEQFISYVQSQSVRTASGEFGASMQVSLCNHGPVTIIIDTIA
ncbi:MAG: D-tyrosyl-tRNA(Tyr) deacylase, partial [Elusimicrobia bacterium]|nr:D-tyrosyl-tRNA(Tyr) deacylase [Elusimicrobiota bacterium]MBD3412548.1 D-tyrosyl-tRNA(Tyr) deacylase [Elusimicrobiota bacterium]